MNDKKGTVLDILKDAISLEIFGKEYYLKCSELIEDEYAKSIFRGLSHDEEEHRKVLEKEFRNISGMSIDVVELEEENMEKAFHIFPEPCRPLSLIDAKNSLKIGIGTEVKSIELYSIAAQKTNDSSIKDLYLKLVHCEVGHKKILEDALYYLEQEGSWYGYSPQILEG
jgi:rubrerythrin